MINEKPESDLLESFYEKFKGSKYLNIYTFECKKSPNMDLEFTANIMNKDYYVRCEAKVASKRFTKAYGDRHNVNHKIFGEIIKGRSLDTASPVLKDSGIEIVYAIFIPKRDFEFFKKKYTFKPSMHQDWVSFGLTFNCKFVNVYDEDEEKLEIYNWENCWLETPPVVEISE